MIPATITDYKGQLLARAGNLQQQLGDKRRTVVCIEAELAEAKRDAALTEGALLATQRDLADLEPLLAATPPVKTPPTAKGPPA